MSSTHKPEEVDLESTEPLIPLAETKPVPKAVDVNSVDESSVGENSDAVDEKSGLPTLPFIAVSACLFANSVSVTVLFPFIFYMIQDFGIAESAAHIRKSGRATTNLCHWVGGPR